MTDGYEQTLYGLIRKRGELTSELDGLRAQTEACMLSLDRIDAAIRVFNPEIEDGDLPARPAPPQSAAFRGEVQRFLLDLLRTNGGPMTTIQCAYAIMGARKLDTRDKPLAKLIRGRTGHALSRLRSKGYISGERYGPGAEMEWRTTARGESGEDCAAWRNGSNTP
jgi:hypothetical protein